jgi:ribosomal protein L37AE/L43A
MKQPPKVTCGQDFDEAVCPVRHKTQVRFLNMGRRVEFPECVSCPHLVTILVDKPIDKKPETPENPDEPKGTEKMKQSLKCKKCGDGITQRIAAGSGTCKKCRQKQYQAAYLAKKNNDLKAPAQAKPTAGGQYVTGSMGCSRCGTTTPVDLLESSFGGPICPTCAGKFDKPAPKTGAKKSICNENAPKVTQEKSNVTFEPAANTIHASRPPEDLPGAKLVIPIQEIDVCRRAINQYGILRQMAKAAEEFAEAAAAINRHMATEGSHEEIISELADVEVMCVQLRMILGASAIDQQRAEKVARLHGRLKP